MPTILLTPNYTGRDGISRLSRAIVAALHGPVSIVALHEPAGRTQVSEGRVLIGCDSRTAGFIWQATALRANARTRVICTHAHLAPAMRTLAWRGAETTLVLCGIEAWEPFTSLRRRAIARADRLVAISSHTASLFREANPWIQEPIAVCHPGVADSPHAAAPAESGEAIIVGRMSSAERYKGHDPLIELWPALLRHVPGARLRIVGGGDDRARLQGRVAALGLRHTIRFAGEVEESELNRMYASAGFFVMPSPNEGFGLVFLEAMRAGLACIGAPGAAGEIIEEATTGFLVDPRRPDELLGALRRLFTDRVTRVGLGAAGRLLFLERFTEAHFAARFNATLGLAPDAAQAAAGSPRAAVGSRQ